MTIFVVSESENQWVAAVFARREDAEVWVREQGRDDDEYSVVCGYPKPSADSDRHKIQAFDIRVSAAYTAEDIDGLRINYEHVLKPRGFVPPEGSNYRLVSK